MSRSTQITELDAVGDNPAHLIDHTLLNPQASCLQIEQLCENAVEWGFAAVCVPPSFARQAVDCLYGSETAVASVIGFPCGYDTSQSKVQQSAELTSFGCAELDMVIPLGPAMNGEIEKVEEEIAQVVIAASGATVKVIIECCYLTDQLKQDLTRAIVRAGAAYVKTSTGFGAGGATVDDVRLLAESAAGRIGVKAAGGIRSLNDLRLMQQAGAGRIGTSSGVEIMQQWCAVAHGGQ